MRTIILNGSPKGNSQNSNSRIFAEEFVRNMKDPCEIKWISKADPEELARYVQDFDAILMILPLYIHAMPGIVMKFIEKLRPATTEGKAMGFIIQAGFVETAQHQFIEPYFEELAKELNYQYLGTVSKGQAAGIYMYPNMFKKVFTLLNDLGSAYEEIGGFNRELVQKLGEPYKLSKAQLRTLNLVNQIGLGNMFWHRELKKNHAFEQKLDRPYLEGKF